MQNEERRSGMRTIMKKWNYETHQYEEYKVPSDWNVSMYETDMKKVVNCAECGKQIKYGESFTSQHLAADL